MNGGGIVDRTRSSRRALKRVRTRGGLMTLILTPVSRAIDTDDSWREAVFTRRRVTRGLREHFSERGVWKSGRKVPASDYDGQTPEKCSAEPCLFSIR